MSVINDAQTNRVCALSITITSYFCLNTAQYRPLHGTRHRKIRSSQCACRGQKVNSIPLNCVLTREFLVKTKLRAVTVADFYHRGGNGPTTAGGAVL